MRSRWSIPVLLAAVSVACSPGETTAAAPDESPQPRAEVSAPAPPEASVPTSTPAPLVPARAVAATALVAPVFVSTVRDIDEGELGASWRTGCPVDVNDLRRVDVTHWDAEGNAIEGAFVIHVDHAPALVAVFERLFDARFPVQSLLPISEFDANDDASMAANNSSGFNCREVAGRPGVWSQHAYGGAIDINPLVNPWVRGSLVDPPGGAAFVDRTVEAAGLIRAGDLVTQAFADIGWTWGGDWSSTIDYQHFSHNGR